MKISELGEFALIDAIQAVIRKGRSEKTVAWRDLVIGIGDDAAMWRSGQGFELATTDSLVQDTHFTLSTIGWRQLGWKALAINLSDIAAMGGRPAYALVALCLPSDVDSQDIIEFYEGMMELAVPAGVAIAGGNLAESRSVVITLSVLGSLEGEGAALTRSEALPGDLIGVTGSLGLSAAGLRMLSQGLSFGQATTALFRRAHNQPQPRVAEGLLLRRCGVRAAIDVSDGLVGDLGHMCAASGVSGVLHMEQMPVHKLLAGAFPRGYRELALFGGEDYELLFTAPATVMQRVKAEAKVPVTVIGEIVEKGPELVTVVDPVGKAIPRGHAGWEHFKSLPGR